METTKKNPTYNPKYIHKSSTRMDTTMWESYLETCIQKPDTRMSYFGPRGPLTCDRNCRNAMPHLPGYVHEME